MLVLPSPQAESPATELEFQSLTNAEKDSLASFFKDTARGMREPWIYTDSTGRESTVRFAEPALVFVQRARDAWDVSVCLCEEEKP